jgi:hypothetical protein
MLKMADVLLSSNICSFERQVLTSHYFTLWGYYHFKKIFPISQISLPTQ